MKSRSIRSVRLAGSPESLGAGHGAAFFAEIGEYAADRMERAGEGSGLCPGDVAELAAACLPAHRQYSPTLYAEMEALAEAAGLTPPEAMVVGGYTDFIDAVRAGGRAPVEDACTAVIVPDELANGAGFLAQTWDMHASATPHIVMLELQPDGLPASLVFTTVGCLGQIGLNEAGLAVGINNLTANDGRPGVTWPFVVRKMLEQTDVDAALACLMTAELAGGHNFLVFDRDGRGLSIEAMPTARHVFELADRPLIHTNHCLVPVTQAREGARPAELQASSVARLAQATDLVEIGPVTVETLMALTRDERSICRHLPEGDPAPGQPRLDYETCGAAIIRPQTGEFWACWGVPSENEFERMSVPALGSALR